MLGLAGIADTRLVLDGEVCVLDEVGRSDFDRLQARAKRRGYHQGDDLVVFCAFDVLVHRGLDVRPQPLSVRKATLRRVLRRRRLAVLIAGDFPGRGTWLYEQAVALGLEGIACKRLDSPYLSGERSDAWVKVKRPGAVPAERFKHGRRSG